MQLFPSTVYTERRQQLKTLMNKGLLLFMGNDESPMNYKDNIYPFRQDSSFLYYFGLDLPACCAIIDLDEDEVILYGPKWTIDDIVWMGPQESLAILGEKVGVKKTALMADAATKIEQAKQAKRPIHFLPPYRAANQLKLEKWLDIPAASLVGQASESLIRAVVKQRSIKQAEEIVELEKALTITGAMHRAAMQKARPGQREAELVGIVDGIAMGLGNPTAYPIILTINGQTLHNHHHHNQMQSGQMVLGDFGGQSPLYYAGDITRTFPVDKTFTDQQKAIYQIVLDAEESVIKALRPGVLYRDMHLMAGRIIGEGLKGLGLMKGNIEEAVAAGAHALFFPHGLGHMLGLDVHDMEDLGEDLVGYDDQVKRSDQFGLAYLRLGRALEEGFVLTVEPGIYFIPDLIDQWKATGQHTDFINYEEVEKWKTFSGIRIEDNVLITATGSQVIGPHIPKTIAEVEAMRNS